MTSMTEFSAVESTGLAATARSDGAARAETPHFAAPNAPMDGRVVRQAAASVSGATMNARTEFERQLMARTAELQEANAALEAFSFIVARELREPLDTIEQLSRSLSKRLQMLDPGLQENCERMHAASQRVRAMVCGLLDYSRGLADQQSATAKAWPAGLRDTAAALPHPPGQAQVATAQCVVPVPVPAPVATASTGGRSAEPQAAVAARRVRMLRELGPLSIGGTLVFAVGLSLIGICVAIL